MRPLGLLLAPVLALAPLPAAATDLGRIGPTYPIGEPHLLDDIQRRLQQKERSGELKRLEEGARDRGVRSVAEPAPAPGLRATTVARVKATLRWGAPFSCTVRAPCSRRQRL